MNTQSFPQELVNKATRITAENIQSQERIQLGEELIEESLTAIQSYEDGTFLAQYRNFSCLFGKNIELQLGKKKITGEVVGIDDEAKLVVRIGNKEVKFSSGEVTRIQV